MRIVFLTLLLLIGCFNAKAIATDTTGGITAPAKVSGDVQSLVNYLCDAMAVDTVKANLIYNWITHNIAFDIKAGKDPDRGEPNIALILKDKKATAEGYTLLFKEMCRAVGLEVVLVKGYAKDWKFDNGNSFYLPNHEWCAIMIDRRWELVDPMAGAGGISRAPGWFRSQLNRFTKEKIKFSKKEVFEFDYSPEFFLMDPLEFRHYRLPADPLWQLVRVVMPMNVFEAGDSAIEAFNKENPERVNRSPELEYIARLNPGQMLVEYADRAYKFNTRYDAVLAYKEHVKASEALAKYASRRHIPPRRTYEDAYRGMVLAEGYLKKQRGYMPEQYNELKKNNITKNKEANDYIRRVRTHNKTLTSQARMHKLAAQRKIDALAKKQDKAEVVMENISPLRIDSIKTSAVQKELNSPAMVALADTIRAKQQRLKKINFSVIEKMQAITTLQEQNRMLSTAMSENMMLADTLLTGEAESRLNFRDNHDDIIKAYMAAFERVRFVNADTIQKLYLKNFDTLVVYYEDLLKIYLQQADLYKTSLRDLEQHRRFNNTDDNIVLAYGNACKVYTECMSQYTQNMGVYNTYLSDNANAFETMATMYEKELDLLDRMEEGETARKEAEETALNEDKTFDERQNDKHQQITTQMLKELTDVLSK